MWNASFWFAFGEGVHSDSPVFPPPVWVCEDTSSIQLYIMTKSIRKQINTTDLTFVYGCFFCLMSQTVSGLLVLTKIIFLLNSQSQLVLRTDKRYQHPLYSCLCHLTPLKIWKISRKADSSVYLRHLIQGCFAFRSFISYFYWILVVSVSFLWITAAPTCVCLQQMWNNPVMNIYVSCKSEMFDHRACRRRCCTTRGLRSQQTSGYAQRMSPPGGRAHPEGLLWFFPTLILSVSEGWKKKKLCVLRISGERDGKHQSSAASEVCLSEKKQGAASTWFCFNKFTLSWETQVLRKTTFVTFILGIVYQTLKRLYHFDSRSPFFCPPAGRRGERREASLSLLLFHYVGRLLSRDVFLTIKPVEIGPR